MSGSSFVVCLESENANLRLVIVLQFFLAMSTKGFGKDGLWNVKEFVVLNVMGID